MRTLSTIAQRLADEIRAQDWSDVHSRADGARHDRALDRKGGAQVNPDETEVVRMNVIWVVGQALAEDDPDLNIRVFAEDDPNLNIRVFAEAAGATESWLRNKGGRPNGGIEAGVRRTAN